MYIVVDSADGNKTQFVVRLIISKSHPIVASFVSLRNVALVL